MHNVIKRTNENTLYGDQFGGKSSLAGKSFCYDGALNYNLIPADIRNVTTLGSFKYKLRKWVKSNIPVD